ncbi:MAG: flagellar filament capping protein FliD [Telluria sp.]
MATISSPGIGSNLDVNGIVSKLMAVESQPLTVLQQKEASYLAKITAYGSVKGSLSSFQTAVNALNSTTVFSGMSTSATDSSVLSATTSGPAAVGSYNVSVTQLAQAQSLSSAGQTSTVSAIGTGAATTISFSFGTISGTATNGKYTGATFTPDASTTTKTVVIDQSNNSLQGIRDAINKANVGVTASIVNDGSGTPYHLLLTSTSTGAARSMKITSSGGDAAVSSLLSNDPAGTQNFTQTVAAQNASLSVNGLAITSATNAVTDAVSGVTMNLSKTGSTSLTVSNNTAAITSAVQNLVKSFNDTNANLKAMTGYDATTKSGGILQGDSVMQSLQAKLRNTLANALPGLGTNKLTDLTTIGIAFQKDGTLTLDSSKLQQALTDHFSDFASLFTASGASTDSLVSFAGSTPKSTPGSYAVSVTSLATQGSASGTSRPTTLTGSTTANLTIGTGNDHLQVAVDGVGPVSVTLTDGSYSDSASLAAQVQTDINTALGAAGQVTVTANGGKLVIASANTDADRSVLVTNDPAVPGDTGADSLLGTPTRTTTITAGGNDELTVAISGTTATVKLAPGDYSDADLAAQLQSAINNTSAFSSLGIAVTAAQSNGTLTVTSARYGSTSAINITGGSAFGNLFSGTATSNPGKDIVGTINGVAATGSGQFLTGATGNAAEGVKVQVLGGTPGARGTMNFSQGYAYRLNQTLTDLLADDGPLANDTKSANNDIDALHKRADALNIQLAATEKRYRAQFTALDTLIGQLSQTSSYLTQQLANLPKMS